MAKWTLKDYINALKIKLDEVGGSYYSDSELTMYINSGIANMADELQIEDLKVLDLEGISFIDFKEIFITPAEATKPIQERSHDFAEIRAIFIDGGPITLTRLEKRQNGGNTAYIWGDKIYFTSEQTGRLEVFYHRLPRMMTSITDTTDVPEQYQTIPLLYAMAQCRQKDEELGQDNYFMQQFTAAKEAMSESISENETDENIRMINLTYLNYGGSEE
jgi:hypothetical protein